MLNLILYYVATNFAILFVIAGFIFFLLSQREIIVGLEKKYYWFMIACSIILLVAVPLERWISDDIRYRELRIVLSVIAYWTRPGALMFLLFACVPKSKYRILFAIPEIIDVIIMGMALFSDFPFGYDKTTYAFIRHPMGYTSHVVGFIYIIMLLVISSRKIKQGYKIESGILFICVIGSSIAVFYTMVSAYEWVSFSIAISGFFHYLFIRSQKHYEQLNKQIEEINQARLEADLANQAKSRFFFNMSHDIRTPMNAIIGFSEIAKRNYDDPEKVKEYLEKIQGSGTYLLNLINEMLEMAKIESGTLKLNETPQNYINLLNSLQSVFETQFKEKNINFVMDSNISHPYVLCDSTKVLEVYFNILSNSLKYTPENEEVTVKINEVASSSSGQNKITYKLVIQDTGIGMSSEYLPHIFDEFSRDQDITDKHITGTGLGMPIVKKLVDLMGGEIYIESELHHGTTVTIIMHHTLSDEVVNSSASTYSNHAINSANINILLAEDNEFNAEIAITLLEDEGYHVKRVDDGLQCIDELTNSGNKYDIILMDVQMPNLNGYETTKRIRELSNSGFSQIPIIAMTANAFNEDRQTAIDSGMNDHIAKPVNIPALNSIIEKYTE